MSERREFNNPYSDNHEDKFVNDSGKLIPAWQDAVQQNILKNFDKLQQGLKQTSHDHSVYTGTTGIALLYDHLATTLFKEDKKEQLELRKKAIKFLEKSLTNIERRCVTFLCGDSGVYACAAVLYFKLGEEKKCEECINNLLTISEHVISDDTLPDELLYGRAGYLYALLYVQKHCGIQTRFDNVIEQVVSAVIKSGLSLSRKEGCQSSLMYAWHGKHYVGAAHGLIGIMYILLQFHPSCKAVMSHISEIKNSIDYILSRQFPSGNFPSSLESNSDRLIHWCHGAPGAVYLMLKAYKVFNEEKYLQSAVNCADVVWKRGLLRKGYGICHGVSGNAYVFLALYKQTGNQMYLHRTLKFSEWCFDYGQHNCRIPDRPLSLFEGLAGTIYFWCDLLEPRKACFPAFEI